MWPVDERDPAEKGKGDLRATFPSSKVDSTWTIPAAQRSHVLPQTLTNAAILAHTHAPLRVALIPPRRERAYHLAHCSGATPDFDIPCDRAFTGCSTAPGHLAHPSRSSPTPARSPLLAAPRNPPSNDYFAESVHRREHEATDHALNSTLHLHSATSSGRKDSPYREDVFSTVLAPFVDERHKITVQAKLAARDGQPPRFSLGYTTQPTQPARMSDRGSPIGSRPNPYEVVLVFYTAHDTAPPCNWCIETLHDLLSRGDRTPIPSSAGTRCPHTTQSDVCSTHPHIGREPLLPTRGRVVRHRASPSDQRPRRDVSDANRTSPPIGTYPNRHKVRRMVEVFGNQEVQSRVQ